MVTLTSLLQWEMVAVIPNEDDHDNHEYDTCDMGAQGLRVRLSMTVRAGKFYSIPRRIGITMLCTVSEVLIRTGETIIQAT